MLILLLAAQSATPPDLQLYAVVDARSVKIEQRGETRLQVHAEPDAGSQVKLEAPKANGARVLSNVRVVLDAQVRLAGPSTLEANVGGAPSDATDTGEPR